MHTLSLDPSLHATGWALFENTKLIDEGLLKVHKMYKGLDAQNRMWQEMLHRMPHKNHYEALVVETQQYRAQGERASIPNLMNLHAVCNMFYCCNYAPIKKAYTPIQWKGNVPKDIMCQRIQKKIGRPDITDDNILDAIGIGLHFFKEEGI